MGPKGADLIKFAGDITYGMAGFGPLDRWRDWATLSTLDLNRQVDGVVGDILGGSAEPATRELMLGAHAGAAGDGTAGAGALRLRELLTIALASPEFQRR